MRPSPNLLKRLVTRVSYAVAAALGGALAVGCVVADTPDISESSNAATAAVDSVPIDTNATLDTGAGNGVGVFVEYASGGHWAIFTACDTATSGEICSFDILVSAGMGSIQSFAGQSLGATDSLELNSDGSLELVARTAMGLDGVTFDTAPGVAIAVTVSLDSLEQARFIYWVGSGILHRGAPTDPVILAPGTP
jgi:hypothetical protein